MKIVDGGIQKRPRRFRLRQLAQLAPGIVLTESVLSFLGLGVQEPMTSWGVLIEDGAQKLEAMPWLLLCPAAMLCATLYCIGFVGDALRDALDPREH